MLINGTDYEIKPHADLREADLRGANLREADLYGAKMLGGTIKSLKWMP